jgi:uncharacterized membrane protein YqaE (UPF0057 family)
MVTLPMDVLNLVLAVILPMVTALVTARFASSTVKSLVLVLLTIISTALQQVFADNGEVDVSNFVWTTAVQFLMSVGFHFGLLKPTNLTGAGGAVANAVPAGIGGPSDRPGNVAD